MWDALLNFSALYFFSRSSTDEWCFIIMSASLVSRQTKKDSLTDTQRQICMLQTQLRSHCTPAWRVKCCCSSIYGINYTKAYKHKTYIISPGDFLKPYNSVKSCMQSSSDDFYDVLWCLLHWLSNSTMLYCKVILHSQLRVFSCLLTTSEFPQDSWTSAF